MTHEGSDPSAAHLEHSFVHEYTPRETTTQSSPQLKKTSNPEGWKCNQRGGRHLGSVPSGQLSFETCAAQDCRCDCSAITMQHRQHIRELAGKVWQQEGDRGMETLVERYIEVAEPNMKTMSKHGELLVQPKCQ